MSKGNHFWRRRCSITSVPAFEKGDRLYAIVFGCLLELSFERCGRNESVVFLILGWPLIGRDGRESTGRSKGSYPSSLRQNLERYKRCLAKSRRNSEMFLVRQALLIGLPIEWCTFVLISMIECHKRGWPKIKIQRNKEEKIKRRVSNHAFRESHQRNVVDSQAKRVH